VGDEPRDAAQWIRHDEIDHGDHDGITTAAAREIRELKRKNAELDQTIEILKAASFFVRRATRDRVADYHRGLLVHRRSQGGVAPICRVLTAHSVAIALRTFHAWATRAPSKRSLWDATITEILAGHYEPDAQGRRKPDPLYGALKTWTYLPAGSSRWRSPPSSA
jgi:hypothetical protein